MKKLKLILILLAVASAVVLIPYMYVLQSLLATDITYEKPEPEYIEVEKPTPEYEVLIKKAQDEAKAQIEAKAKEAYDETYNLEMDKISAQVLAEYEAKINSLKTEKQEAIDSY